VLEIILLFVLGKNIAAIARRKNRNPVGYVLLLVFGWFGLGFVFAILAVVIGMAAGMNEDEVLLPAILGYLVGAACAAGLAYLVVGAVSPLRRKRRFDDEDDYDDYEDRPRRRRPRDEDPYDYDDEPDDPRSRRRPRDEDDYDRPRRRRDDY
jgi:hypothetical protein